MAERYLREFDRDPEAVGNADDNRPEMSDFSLEAELLTEIVNELRASRAEAIAVAGGRAAKPRYRKGPASAIERVRYRIREEEHLDLVSRLAPRDERGRRVQPVRADPAPAPDSMGRDTLLT